MPFRPECRAPSARNPAYVAIVGFEGRLVRIAKLPER
jgi:hypothetical protein